MTKRLFFLLAFSPFLLFGQHASIDSLTNCLRLQKADTARVNTLNELAWQLKRSRPRDAYAYASEALQLSKQLKFRRGTGEAFNNLGNISDNLSKYDSALYFHNEALAVYQSIGYKKGIASSYNNIGEINRTRAHYGEALDFYFKSVAIKKELGDKKSLASTYNNIGITYVALSDFGKGLEFQLQSLRLKEEAGDQARIGSSCQNIGNLYHQLKNDSAALRYTSRAVDLFRVSGDSLSLSRALSNQGSILAALGRTKEALECLSASLLIAERLGAPKEQLNVCNNYVNLFGNTKQYDSAIAYSKRALLLASQLGDSIGLGLIHHNLGQVYNGTGRPELALQSELLAEQIAKHTGDERVLRDVYRVLAELYEAKGDFKKAFFYQREFLQLTEKAFNDATAKQLAQQQELYESEKKLQLIRDLQQQQRISQLELSASELRMQQQHYLIIGLSVALFLLFVSAVLFFSRRRAIARMREERAALLAGERERIRIAKDIHDDLGSGLTRIGMLTRTVSGENSDTRKTDALLSINRMSTELTESMRDLVWALHPENATLNQLVARLREFSGDFFEDTGFAIDRHFPKQVPEKAISKELLRAVYLVFKESLNNAARHSGAQAIAIHVALEGAELHVRIVDNGKGFQAETAAGNGNGLLNMQNRIRQLGGKMKIDSEVGKGTTVTFQVTVF